MLGTFDDVLNLMTILTQVSLFRYLFDAVKSDESKAGSKSMKMVGKLTRDN